MPLVLDALHEVCFQSSITFFMFSVTDIRLEEVCKIDCMLLLIAYADCLQTKGFEHAS